MAWIESHQDLRTNPKAKRLARMLDVPLAQAIGHLHMLWWWALDHAEDGDLSRFDAYDIADAAGWDGDPDPFLKALIDCGPSDKHGFIEPTMQLHDWGEFTLGIRASRESAMLGNHKRWHEKRGITDPSCPHCPSPPNRPRIAPESPPTGLIAPESPPTSPPNRGDEESAIAPDSSHARAHVESTDLPTNQPTGGTARTRDNDAEHDQDFPPPPQDPDQPQQPTPTPARTWDQAWSNVGKFLRAYAAQDPNKPALEQAFDPRTVEAVRAVGGITRIRTADKPDAMKFAFRDAWLAADKAPAR